jgi:hypothetical protein
MWISKSSPGFSFVALEGGEMDGKQSCRAESWNTDAFSKTIGFVLLGLGSYLLWLGSLVLNPGWLWGPLSLLFSGYSGAFTGLKQLGCEADHLPRSSAEVENEWSYSSTIFYAFIACTGTLPLLIVSRNQVCIGDLKWFVVKHRISFKMWQIARKHRNFLSTNNVLWLSARKGNWDRWCL